jgi:hypothetical protein
LRPSIANSEVIQAGAFFGGSRFRGFLKRKIRDWMAPMERFIFGAICRGFIPEASSSRSISLSASVQRRPAGRGPVISPSPARSQSASIDFCLMLDIGTYSRAFNLSANEKRNQSNRAKCAARHDDKKPLI